MVNIDPTIILYSIASTFKNILKIEVCEKTDEYIDNLTDEYEKLDVEERVYYSKYCNEIGKLLNDYLPNIHYFEINTDINSQIVHDFKLTWDKNETIPICLNYNTVGINNIIPRKLMKACRYQRNTNISKKYIPEYARLNNKCFKKLKKYEKFSKIPAEKKMDNLLEPFTDLVVSTISRKKKCANNLFNHMFSEVDRIVIKLHKTKFFVYDFSKDIDRAERYRIKKLGKNMFSIQFNNGAVFHLTLKSNSDLIKKILSIKFTVAFYNIDELFLVNSIKI